MEQSEFKKSLAERKKLFEKYLVEIRTNKKTASKIQDAKRNVHSAK